MWLRSTSKIRRKYKYQACRASSPRLKAGDSARRLVIVLAELAYDDRRESPFEAGVAKQRGLLGHNGFPAG